MSTLIALLFYVVVFALVVIFDKDKRTPDEELEELLNRPYLHDTIDIPKKRRKDFRNLLNSLKELREETRKRMQEGSLTKSEVYDIKTNIPLWPVDGIPASRLGREMHKLGSEFMEELRAYYMKQGCSGRRENRFKEENHENSLS